MEEQIKTVLASVLGIDASDINSDSSSESIEVWDSLKHMNLIVAIEDEFDVEIDDDDVPKMLSVKGIIEVVENSAD